MIGLGSLQAASHSDSARRMKVLTSDRSRILVVDDDRKVLDFVVELLDQEGYKVKGVTDGAQALDLATSDEVDLIISDVVMPRLNGIELCRRLKQQPKTANIPVLLMSGNRISLDDSIEGLTAGADDYLEIPFRHEALLVKVARLTERHYAERSIRQNEERYRELFANANDIIYTHDLSGNFTSLNRSGERITGYTSEEAAQMNIANVVAPEYLELARQMILKKTEGDAPTVYELEIFTKDRRRVRLELSTRVIFNGGKPVGVQGIARDITERLRAETALAQQAQREAMTNRISQAIRCSLDSSEIFQTAVRELGSYLKVDRCSLFMKGEGGNVRNVAEYHAEGVLPAASDFKLVDLKALVQTLGEKGVLVFEDAAHDKRISDLYERILSKADVRSIMYVAIRVEDDVPAAFALSTTRELRQWSDSDITLAKAVADQTGIAIRQAKLYQKAEGTSIREALVNRLTLAIRASLSLSEVLSTATRELGTALSASRVHLHLANADNSASLTEHEFVAPGCESLKSVGHEDALGRYLLEPARPVIAPDAFNYSEGPQEHSALVRDYARRFNIHSLIDYPLIVKGQFRGVICIHQTDRVRHWTEDEIALIDAVAARLVIGIAQAELFEMVARGKQEWETTFDAMSDGIFIFDSHGQLKRVNNAGAAMEHTHPRLLLGRKCCEILRTDTQAETCVVEKAIAQSHSVTIEITPTELNRPVLVSVEPIIEQDKTIGVVCTARDLTELRTVQAVAREHQTLLTNILESARESIYAVDNDGRFKWCNSATLAGLGQKRETFIGRPLLNFVYEGDRELVAEKLKTALSGEAQTYEMRYFSPDGRLRYARVDNAPLIIDAAVTGVLGIARDITEQKEERERAARADKLRALGQLASGVAHDFNNSLAAILGRAQLLRRQTDDDALVRNLEIIQTAAEDAAATVRRIQTFARTSPVKEFEMLDVRELLSDAIEITRTRWQNEARLRGLDYEVELEAEEGQYTYGSASELREVFVNLIVNAVDAMPGGGKLSITCERKDEQLWLKFADSGVGMPDDMRQKIFEPFFTTKGAHGTGLGLSVSHSIIERHDGSISVESEPGQGTVFTINLPVSQIGFTEIDSLPASVEGCPLSILVIDDEPSVRETLADMLEMLNHTVEIAESGQEALKKIAVSDFDLVFTDLAMPEMDGWETAREIRKRLPEMNIVLVTGYGSGTEPPPGEDHLVNGIIGKPFDFDQVTQVIADVVGQRSMEKVTA